MPPEPPKPYRIALLCNSRSWGGLEMNVARLGSWLAARGHTVLALGPADAPFLRECAAQGVDTAAFASRRKYGDIRAMRQLAVLLQRHRPQVLLTSTSKDISLAVQGARWSASGVAVVYYQQMQFGHPKRDWIHTWFYRRLAAWVSPLPWLRAQTLANTRIDASRVHVIPLGIDPEPFLAAPTQAEARHTLHLPPDVPLVGIVGRLDPGKGQLLLVEALALLRARGLLVHALFVGAETVGAAVDGFTGILQARVAALDLTAQVHLRPFMANPATAYAALDVFVMGSDGETYGMTTLEAMASGTPVLATRTGGPVELVRDGETGRFFTPKDAHSLAEALASLLAAPDEAARLAANARQAVRQTYTHTQECEAFERLFAQIVPLPGAKPGAPRVD